MRYTGTKYSQIEAEAIMSSARATSATVRADMQRWRAEQQQQQPDGATIITKTIDHARAPAPPARAPDDVDGIDAGIRSVLEIAGEAHGRLQRDVQEGFRKRDREIESLRREIKMLRDEVGLERGLTALKAEVKQARQQAPNFKTELARLQEEIGTQRKTIVRLRAQNSTLEYGQKALDKELSRIRRESTPSAAVVQLETSSSRITVGNLHPDAAAALREFASQVLDAWDGDAILFSGPVGTA